MRVPYELPFTIRPEEIAARIGAAAQPRRRVREEIAAGIRSVERAARPRAASSLVRVEPTPDGFRLDGRHAVHSRRLKPVFARCPEALAFIVSLGPGVDELIARTRRLGEAYIVDAIASAAVEQVADSFHREVRATLAPGQDLSFRYSPGYCDWPLAGQDVIFSLVRGSEAGVTLSRHRLMQPRKSVSGLIGIGSRELIAERGNACRWCRTGCENKRAI